MTETLIAADTVETKMSDEVSKLRSFFERDSFGGPRAVAQFDLVNKLSSKEVTPLYPLATGMWKEKKLIPNGIRGTHMIAGTNDEVVLELSIPDLEPKDELYWRARVVEPVIFKAESPSRCLQIFVKEGCITKHGREHIVNLSESANKKKASVDLDSAEETFFQNLRSQLYAREVSEIVAKAGISCQVLFDEFNHLCPRSAATFTEEPKTDYRDVAVSLFEIGEAEFYVNGTSRLTSFRLTDELKLDNDVTVQMNFRTKNDEHTDYIEAIELEAVYLLPELDNHCRSRITFSSFSYVFGDDKRGSLSLEKVDLGYSNWKTGELIGLPIPQIVNDFFNDIAVDIEKERINRFGNIKNLTPPK